MKTISDFFKSVVAGGFFVILPLLVIILVFGELIGWLVQTTEPMARSLPFTPAINVLLTILLVIAQAILICFAAGLVVRSRLGGAFLNWLEGRALSKIPLYSMIKNLTLQLAGRTAAQFIPAEVDLYGSEGRVLGLIVEELPDDRLAVFIPAVPAATVGQLHILPRKRVHVLDTSLTQLVNSITQWGVGTRKLYEKQQRKA